MRYPKFSLKTPPDPNSVMGMLPIARGPKQGLLAQMQERFMPSPASGLLSEEDIKNARQQGLLGLGASLLAESGPRPQGTSGFMEGIGRGVQGGQQAYQGAIGQAQGQRAGDLNAALAQQQLQGGQQEQQQQIALQAARQKLFAENPPPADERGYITWAKQMWPRLAEIGDTKFADHLKTIIATDPGQQQGAKEPGSWVTVPGPNGQPMRRYVTASEAGQGIPEYEKKTRDAGATLLDEQRMFSRANQLEGDYRQVTKSIQQAADQVRTMTAMADGAKAGSPQAQIGLIFSFMKTLDPQSVVRESEYATAQNAAGVPERIRNQYNKVLDGSFLTPEQIDGFIRAGQGSARQWKRQQDLHRKTFNERATRWGLNPQDVTIDFFDGLDLGGAPERMPGVQGGGSSTAPAGAGGAVDNLRKQFGRIQR